MWKVVWARNTRSIRPSSVSRNSQLLGFLLGVGSQVVIYESYLISSWYMFSMVTINQFEAGSGSGSGASGQDRQVLSIDHIREMISVEVSQILQVELFGVVDRSPLG